MVNQTDNQKPTPASASASASAIKNTTPHVTQTFPDNLNTDSFKAQWARWVKYRNETRHKLTPTTIDAQLSKLSKMGEAGAFAAIQQSLDNGWQGLFEAKPTQSTTQRQTATERKQAALDDDLIGVNQ